MGGETIVTSHWRKPLPLGPFLDWHAVLLLGGSLACVLPLDFRLCTTGLGAPASSLGFLMKSCSCSAEPYLNPLPSRLQSYLYSDLLIWPWS